MIRHRTIRSLLAGLFLVLFALSVTPKIAIHALVAHHTDTHPALHHDEADQLNKAGFHCSIDNLVVESPFLDYSVAIVLGIPPSFPVYRPAPLKGWLSSTHFIFGLRGPPAIATI
ncbi:MAG TPA: hypothetical protein VGM30_09300 [Puia sp.]